MCFILQIKTNFEFRRNNFAKVQKISNDNFASHMGKKEHFEISSSSSIVEQEFRRKIPHRQSTAHIAQGHAQVALGPAHVALEPIQSKSDKKLTGWGTDLDCFVKSPAASETTTLDNIFKCEICNFTTKYQSYMNQHYETDIYKNNLKKSLNIQNEDKNETLETEPNDKELQEIMKNILETVIAHEDDGMLKCPGQKKS